jgi:dipeptidyl aminopeptidase/acylaminoacyl peptidase
MRLILTRAGWPALALILSLAAPAAGQQKSVLMPADYGRWETLGTGTLSPDGKWLAYEVGRVEGDGELRLRDLGSDSTRVIPLGSKAVFSADSRWLAYSIGLPERERLEQAKQPVRGQVGILELGTGAEVIVEGVASFAFSEQGGYLALRGYPRDGQKQKGVDVVVRDLAAGLSTNFGNVAEFAWQGKGTLLALAMDAEARAGNGVQLFDPATGLLRTLASDTAVFTGLVWRKEGDDLAVLRVLGDSMREGETHRILAWRGLAGRRVVARSYDPGSDARFPADTRIVGYRPLRWADDGGAIFFGIKEWARKATPPGAGLKAASDSAAAPQPAREEPANVEVWHAADVDIIPEQKVRAPRDRDANTLAVWHLVADRFVQLGDSLVEDVTLAEGQRLALGGDRVSYERERMFGPVYRDQYLIDVLTGTRQKIAERVQFSFGTSPGARYFLYLQDDHYWSYDLRSGARVNLTGALPTAFVNHEDDHTVAQKPPFGVAGWTKGDRSVILYDKYDLWEVRPDGSGATRLTDGAAEQVRYRYVRLDPEEIFIDPARPLYLSAYGEWTKKFGYARLRLGRAAERLVWLDRNVGRLSKAKAAEVYAYVAQGFDESPNYFVGGPGLAEARRVTTTNPFQGEFAWGRAELVDFTNARGEKLQGSLYYPANYEPGKQYPMIVYIYEIRSNTVHNYTAPSERSPYNPTVFTSQGYFFFQPDITYRDRNPGLSAVESIVPAVEQVLETGMIDRARIGLVGHSWGAYQTAFTVTPTDLFAAAVAGAPLTNLISMSLQVYWNTGGTNARIFEISQGRMEVPFWQDLEAYAANSPVFHIERMRTPLLVAFGDKDGAVDWSQGVELYNAARRAGKEMVMLVYPGENHSLRQKPNQIDYHRRIVDWFGHYLKDTPAPRWMTHGVSVLERERELEQAKQAKQGKQTGVGGARAGAGATGTK